MDKQLDDLSEGKINAGRGVAKDKNSNSRTKPPADKSKDDDRLDNRVRKAGY